MSTGATVLEMRGVSKSFDTAHGAVHVLRSVDFAIANGEFIAVMGPSGSGKSTFLNLASLLDKPTSGKVVFEDADVSSMRERELCEVRKYRTGMVFQNFNLLTHRTALENVMFRFRYLQVPRREARDRAMETLQALGLEALASQPARLLSGGEMQRVAIARAVAQPPRLLLADEPTGNLDKESAHTVMETLKALNADGMSIILVTHNEALLPYCSRHLVCDERALR
jgi:putative ABC transport system ATP-binding protein